MNKKNEDVVMRKRLFQATSNGCISQKMELLHVNGPYAVDYDFFMRFHKTVSENSFTLYNGFKTQKLSK